MDGFSRCRDPQLVSKERDMFRRSSHGSSEENKQLELTLGPPGASPKLNGYKYNKTTCNESLLSLGHGTIKDHKKISSLCDHTLGPWPSSAKFPSGATQDESLKHCSSTKMVKLQTSRNNDAAAEKQRFVTTVPETSDQSQKRTAPVVGWPPIRSFRKNLASSSSTKPSLESQNDKQVTNHAQNSTTQAGLFVKINMDGIPIGRKIDLNAYDSYENLSAAVDKLFRGLLAVQTDSFTNGTLEEEEKPITGLLDGSGEYTLVYEDIEGDRVLVGDVPWRMFVSTVKRLRVLKTSDISSLSIGSKKQKMELESQQ